MTKKKKKRSNNMSTNTSYRVISPHTTPNTVSTITSNYKPKIKTSDIDSFIGRATIKDEVTNIEKLWTYSGFYHFISSNLPNDHDISKNDIARTWNLITRIPTGLSKVKKLPYTRLNLLEDVIVYDTSYNEYGKKIESNGYLPVFAENYRISRTIRNIDFILSLFLKPWHYKIKRYDTGIALWINPKVDKLMFEKYKPGNMVKYYKSNSSQGGTAVWTTTEYPYVPEYLCSSKKKDSSGVVTTLGRGLLRLGQAMLH